MPKLTRAVSKPFVDLGNYFRPHLHTERGISSDQAHALALERQLSGGIGSSTVTHTHDYPDTPGRSSPKLGDESPVPSTASSPPLESPADTEGDSPEPLWTSLANPSLEPLPSINQSPILDTFDEAEGFPPVFEDAEGEAAAEESFERWVGQAHQEQEPDDEVDESFATAQRSLDLDAFESPEACRRRSHSWHALDLSGNIADADADTSGETLAISPPSSPLLQPHAGGADDSSSCSGTPSLLGANETTFDFPSPRDSEDSYDGPATPNTSVPLCSPERTFDWSPGPVVDRKGKGKARAEERAPVPFPTSTSTPPRTAVPGFIEVIETCPTPEHTLPRQFRPEERRRSLVTSGLGIDLPDEAGEVDRFSDAEEREREQQDDDEEDDLPPLVPSIYSFGSSRDDLSFAPGRSQDSLLLRSRRERITVVEPSLDSYSSSVYPDAAHFDSYTRRPRRRPSLKTSEEADEPSSSRPNSVPPPPRHTRPITSPNLSPHARAGSSYFSSPPLAGPSSSRNLSSPVPFSSLLPLPLPSSSSTVLDPSVRPSDPHPLPLRHLRPLSPSWGAHPRPLSPVLRAQASKSTLHTYDLAHLPAPGTPRARPLEVPLRKVLLPTPFLGGGKGSGLYGDAFAPVERRAETAATGTGKRRSLSLMSLSGLVRSRSSAPQDGGRRRSFFGLSGLAGGAEPIVEEEQEDRTGADEDAEQDDREEDEPAWQHRPYAFPPAASAFASPDPALSIDDFAGFVPPLPSSSAQSTLRDFRPLLPHRQPQRPNTAPSRSFGANAPSSSPGSGGGLRPLEARPPWWSRAEELRRESMEAEQAEREAKKAAKAAKRQSMPISRSFALSRSAGHSAGPLVEAQSATVAPPKKLGRSASLAQSLSRLTGGVGRRSSLARSTSARPSTAGTGPERGEDEERRRKKERRRSSLAASIFGSREEDEPAAVPLHIWHAIEVRDAVAR
ncbi:hypothetical protein JCM8097_001088 [Rhodosporidiobolus ruineniae]